MNYTVIHDIVQYNTLPNDRFYIPCFEKLTNALTKIILEINYVVKGGKAADLYIYQPQSGMIRFTDWDIACNTITDQNTIAKAMMDILTNKYPNSQFIKEHIKINMDDKDHKSLPGIQIGLKCEGTNDFFADIMLYPPSDSVFTNVYVDDVSKIKYANIQYVKNDIYTTLIDRINILNTGMNEWSIDIQIDINMVTSNIDVYINTIYITLINRAYNHSIEQIVGVFNHEKDKDDVLEISTDDINADINDIKTSFNTTLSDLSTTTLPMYREKFEKLFRTLDRYRSLLQIDKAQMKAGSKRRTKSKNKYKRKSKSIRRLRLSLRL